VLGLKLHYHSSHHPLSYYLVVIPACHAVSFLNSLLGWVGDGGWIVGKGGLTKRTLGEINQHWGGRQHKHIYLFALLLTMYMVILFFFSFAALVGLVWYVYPAVPC
jgi:hypothetical protein